MDAIREGFLRVIAVKALNEAEAVWGEVGSKLAALSCANSRALMEKAGVVTQIPGYPIIEDGPPIVDDFIALVVDMRDSTKHLLQAIKARASQLQRVYYETSALLPCLSQCIAWQKGAVTEYLGDGVLAMFKASPNSDNAIYSAYYAANDCIAVTQSVINPLIRERYQLPNIEIGVGLAYSKAVVTLVGLKTYQQPKVFGECVFRATKLASKHKTIVVVDKAMRYAWPTSTDGKIKFSPIECGDIEAYQVQ